MQEPLKEIANMFREVVASMKDLKDALQTGGLKQSPKVMFGEIDLMKCKGVS